MKRQLLFLPLLIIGLISCSSPKMDEDQISKALLVEDGIIGGIDMNDSWEDVKKIDPDFWTVREADGIYQLRKEWDDFNHLSLSVNLNNEQKVNQIELTLTGRDDNGKTIASIYNKLVHFYSNKFDKKSEEEWGKQLEHGNVNITVAKLENNDSKDLTITSNILFFEH